MAPSCTQAAILSKSRSTPTANASLLCVRKSSSTPRPHPRSSTRLRGSTQSAMICMSTVRLMAGLVMASLFFQKSAHESVELRRFEQERVVAEVGRKLGITGALAGAQEREDDRAVLFGREKPVAGKADTERLGLHRRKGLLER